MKKLTILLAFIALAFVFATSASANSDECTTIQSGNLQASNGTVISTGFDDWGYNYQGRFFKGGYCDAYRDAAWCQEWKDDYLSMK